MRLTVQIASSDKASAEAPVMERQAGLSVPFAPEGRWAASSNDIAAYASIAPPCAAACRAISAWTSGLLMSTIMVIRAFLSRYTALCADGAPRRCSQAVKRSCLLYTSPSPRDTR